MGEAFQNKCMICGKEFRNYLGLARHISQAHPEVTNQEYYDKYLKKPGDGVCQCCGQPTGFSGRLNRGYYTHCSKKCTANDRKTVEKRKVTSLEVHGDANFNNHAKTMETKLERYGDANYANGDQIRGTKMERYGIAGFNNPEKRKATKLGKYGASNYVNSEKCAETKLARYGSRTYNNSAKMQETKLERYGESAYVNPDKARHTVYARTVEKYTEFLGERYDILEYSRWTFRCRCRTCGNEFELPITTGYMRLFRYGTEWCTVCNPPDKNRSSEERSLFRYVETLVGEGKVEKSAREILGQKEIDIYVPDAGLCIEFDGLYWHDERRKSPGYHLYKTEECERRGLRLLHVFEDEWEYRKDIVKSRISGILGKNRKVSARKCRVVELSSGDAGKFLDENHIQGSCVSKWRYGLELDGECVAVMTFGEGRFADAVELLRYSSAIGMNVVGGASRLFSHFVKDHPDIMEIVSYADRRWSGVSAFYPKLGFECTGKTLPSYYYVIGGTRHNRMEFTKGNLVAAGFPKDMSEHEIMLSRKIYRIYDCGNWRYVWHR